MRKIDLVLLCHSLALMNDFNKLLTSHPLFPGEVFVRHDVVYQSQGVVIAVRRT